MESCDVLMVNSLKDGMNLVAKEWAVVSQRPGVLILSETAGVVEEASDSALLVSPLDVEGTAKVMAEALEIPGTGARRASRAFSRSGCSLDRPELAISAARRLGARSRVSRATGRSTRSTRLGPQGEREIRG